MRVTSCGRAVKTTGRAEPSAGRGLWVGAHVQMGPRASRRVDTGMAGWLDHWCMHFFFVKFPFMVFQHCLKQN